MAFTIRCKHFLILVLALPVMNIPVHAQLPPVFDPARMATAQTTPTTRIYLSPTRILWRTPGAGNAIVNAERFLLPGNGQADLSNKDMCILRSTAAMHPALLFDFGRELHGGLQLVTGMFRSGKPVRVRVRFGESVSEAMSDVEPVKNATNDHAMRDEIVQVPWLGKLETGNTGFRFVRIDLPDDSTELQLKEVRAIFIYREIPYLGSFHSSDSLLDKIWMTGAYTVHLNMQDYLWDGIKRDRLVWVGDMHPETSTISAVFGYNEVVPRSLDLARDITPLPQYMNGMVSYSMWWILIQHDWYMHTGNLSYLKQQAAYLRGLLEHLCTKIDGQGREQLDDGVRFLDWPSSENKAAVHAGLQGMLIMALHAGAELSRTLHDAATAKTCEVTIEKLRRYVPDGVGSKQAGALLALSGLVPADKVDKEILSVAGVKNYSTFFGYYMLQAKARAGNYQGAINDIRTFWGGMLAMGATTFWEDFNMDWVPGAPRIDQVPAATGEKDGSGPGNISGGKDIHGDYGAYCYKGYRHSLCHGWASGPTAWLTEHVLGIMVVEPGCRVLRIVPHLGDLSFAAGTFPTPLGIVHVKHTRLKNGKVVSSIQAPPGVRIIRE